jgi:uncharacterized protein
MRRFAGSWIFLIVMLLIDWYVFQAIKVVTQHVSPKTKFWIHGVYWLVSMTGIIIIALLPYLNIDQWTRAMRTYVFASIIGLFLAKMIVSVFLMADDVRRLMQWGGGKLFYGLVQGEPFTGANISRSTFLSWMGLAFGSTLFSGLVYGFWNKYRFQVQKVKLKFDNLPEAFRGFKVLHISDIHSGSFNDPKAVMRGVEMILQQEPDVILFTGDLVNDHSDEMDDYKEIFAKLKAPYGVYSTLGNHDYGDYRIWPSPEAKAKNLQKLKDIHAGMGWRLLMNEHVPLEKDGSHIGLLGIENWSAKGSFPKYGSMEQAYSGSDIYPFKILMSHDPSHWDAEIKVKYTDVDLMLAGHTHGMQFGVELPWLKWSPVQYVYKQWAGLYEEGAQKLYVNRGFGFIGYPGRVGILPEITLIELS